MPRSNKLTDHQTAVVELMKTPGFTWSTVAKRLGCGVTSVKDSHAAAMKKLTREAAGEALPEVSAKSLRKPARALARYMKSMGRVTDKTIGDGLDQAIAAIQFQLGLPEVVATASFRDLSSSLGILIDRRQLLQGEPTAITRFQDIRKLDEMTEMLNAELKRRGKMIDVTPEAG